MTFSSSRTLPGIVVGHSSSIASSEITGGAMPMRVANRSVIIFASSGMSDMPLAQRRHAQLDHVDTVVEILAEATCGNQLAEVAVGRRKDAHVDRLLALVADRARGLFLDQAQELHLHREWQVGDFVEEQRAALGRLHEARLVGNCAGEAAAAVTEKLALHQFRRYRAAADGHERCVLARPALVDQARDQFLAGAGLAGDVHRRLAPRHAADHGPELLHRLGIAEE